MILLDYLNSKFPGPDYSGLNVHFKERYGVNVRQEGTLFQFKYDMIDGDMGNPLVKECRGVILDSKDGWVVCARPFDKFFNQHEGHCPLFSLEAFRQNLDKIEFVEKADGTCIMLWNYDNSWRVSTLGTITTMAVQDSDITFNDLFWEVGKFDLGLLDPKVTYIFELCCEDNQILTKYPNDRIYLIGARQVSNGVHLSKVELDKLADRLGIYRPSCYSAVSLGITSLEDAKMWVDNESKRDIYGKYPEGFVLFVDDIPIAKMKNSVYLSLHHVSGGDIKHSRKNIILSVLKGLLDDIRDILSVRMVAFADEVSKAYSDLVKAVVKSGVKVYNGGAYKAQKDYALMVQANVDRSWHGFFFSNKELILRGNPVEIDNGFKDWMKANCERFVYLFKGNND